MAVVQTNKVKMVDILNKLVIKLRFTEIFDTIPGWIYYFSSKIIDLQASPSGRDFWQKSEFKL